MFNIIESAAIVKSIIGVVKDVLKAHGNRLRLILEPPVNMKEFTTRMLQADLITDVVAQSSEYQVVMNDFLSCLEYSTAKHDIERDCNTLLGILSAIGGPCKRAAAAIRHDILEAVKNKHNIELSLM